MALPTRNLLARRLDIRYLKERKAKVVAAFGTGQAKFLREGDIVAVTVCDVARPALPYAVLAVCLTNIQFAVAGIGDKVNALDVRQRRPPGLDILRDDDIELRLSQVDPLEARKPTVADSLRQQLRKLKIVLERLAADITCALFIRTFHIEATYVFIGARDPPQVVDEVGLRLFNRLRTLDFEEPGIQPPGSACIDQRHDESSREIPSALPSLPIVEISCDKDVHRPFPAIKSGEVNLGTHRREAWFPLSQKLV